MLPAAPVAIIPHTTLSMSHEPRGRIARHAGGSLYVAAAGTTPIRSIGGVPARRLGCVAGRCRRLRPRAHMVVARAGQEKCCAEVWSPPFRVQGAPGARAAVRAYMQTPLLLPLPHSLRRSRRCAVGARARTHTSVCSSGLGFRVYGFRKRAFLSIPRKTCAQALQCRTLTSLLHGHVQGCPPAFPARRRRSRHHNNM